MNNERFKDKSHQTGLGSLLITQKEMEEKDGKAGEADRGLILKVLHLEILTFLLEGMAETVDCSLPIHPFSSLSVKF